MERGVDIGIDLVALLFSMTTCPTIFPLLAADGGVDKAAERLKDGTIRKEVVEYHDGHIFRFRDVEYASRFTTRSL